MSSAGVVGRSGEDGDEDGDVVLALEHAVPGEGVGSRSHDPTCGTVLDCTVY